MRVRRLLIGAVAATALLSVVGALARWRGGPRARIHRAAVAQASCPSGRLSGPVARLLNMAHRGMATETLDAAGDPGDRLLDVGFGGGALMRLALERHEHLRVSGLEPSPEMVARAERGFADEMADGRVDARAGAIEDIPWADDTFSVVVTMNTPYFWRDQEQALAEIRRVLRPGGRVLIALPGAELQRRIGLDAAGHEIVEPEDLAETMRADGYEQVETRTMSAERRRGAVLITAGAPASPS
jgi:SAM-dependent methyltransferase